MQFPEKFKPIFDSWNTNTILVFLNTFLDIASNNPSKINKWMYEFLRDELKLHTGYNIEICNIWYQICLILNHEDVVIHVVDLLSRVGRMKYLKPLYKGLYNFKKETARETFSKYK